MKKLFEKPDLMINRKGTLNKQEKVEIMLDSKSKRFVAFENKPFYNEKCFISSYEIDAVSVDQFAKTGNIGLHTEKRKLLKDADQKLKAKKERIEANKKSYYSTLPADARISNRQFRDVQMIRDKLKDDPNFVLTDQQKSLLERAQKHEAHKKEFYKNNPHLLDGEL